MKEKILLIGGGGHCCSCIDIIETQQRFEIVGIIDKPHNVGKLVLGYKIIGSDSDLPALLFSVKNVLITIGQIKNYEIRSSKFDELKKLGFQFPVIVSPRAFVSPHAKIGEGTIIMQDALVVAGAVVGKNCIINNKALIEHDSIIEDHCHISTGAIVNGGCKIEEKTFIGSNAVIKEEITVASKKIVPAGCFYKGTRT
jgi:sugar O-acyltransferase (sialic acid O-acetyltransferase NeuD family)